jgi:hypothetical protein
MPRDQRLAEAKLLPQVRHGDLVMRRQELDDPKTLSIGQSSEVQREILHAVATYP